MPVYSWRNTKSGNNKTQDFSSGRRWSCIPKVQFWQRLCYFKKKTTGHRYFGGGFGQGIKFIVGGMNHHQSTVPPLGFHWKEQGIRRRQQKDSYQTAQFYSWVSIPAGTTSHLSLLCPGTSISMAFVNLSTQGCVLFTSFKSLPAMSVPLI